MLKRLIILTSFLVLPILASAHGTNYLEFNPDYFRTKSLNVSSAGNIYEILLPVNEFLGGMDFWFDNAGSSGTATFELRDQNNNFLTSRIVTIPHIDPVSGGQRVHVDLSSQASVIGGNVYRIKISSVLPQLRIYYSDRVKFLPHNEPHISEYVNGTAEINGEEQQFSFKFALYETVESSAPIISNIAWTIISEAQIRVDFNVNEPTDYRIEYGLSGQGYSKSTSFNADFEICIDGITTCDLTLNVEPDSTYQYRLTVKDSWGNQSQATGTFASGQSQVPTPIPTSTLSATPSPSLSLSPSPTASATPTGTTSPVPIPSPPDGIPLAISNLRVAAVTDRSVDIAWTTNEAANSHLLISTPFLITVTDASDPILELEHLLRITSHIGANVRYLATVTSNDVSGDTSRASLSFTTMPFMPPATPTPSPVQQPPITTQSGGSGGSIQWQAPASGEPSNGYRIDVFDEQGNLVRTIHVPAGYSKSDISDLADGEYKVIVYADNKGVFEKINQPVTLEVGSPFLKRLLNFWWALIPLLAGLGYIVWRNRKKVTPAFQVPV